MESTNTITNFNKFYKTSCYSSLGGIVAITFCNPFDVARLNLIKGNLS